MAEQLQEMLEAHRAYYADWNRAFGLRKPELVTAWVSSAYSGTFVGGPDSPVEVQEASNYCAGLTGAIMEMHPESTWTIQVLHAEMRRPDEGLILYRAELNWPGGGGTELFMEVWRKEEGAWRLVRGYEEIL